MDILRKGVALHTNVTGSRLPLCGQCMDGIFVLYAGLCRESACFKVFDLQAQSVPAVSQSGVGGAKARPTAIVGLAILASLQCSGLHFTYRGRRATCCSVRLA